VSGEEAKHGFEPAQVSDALKLCRSFQFVHVEGLMTMAAFEEDPEKCRPTFRALRQLWDELAWQVELPHQMKHLSMGMTNDFEIAIEEGATLVRIGTALFEGMSGEVA
jgi:uncharacterized pyridoxal phosphate-containing UPF0001 family protein